MADSDNPILYIEELRRLPLRRRRGTVPGVALVFRSRNGRLSAPPRGYTPGELWWRGPRLGYEVDITRHQLEMSWEALHGPDRTCVLIEVGGVWFVADAAQVVAHRVSDAAAVARHALRERVERLLAGLDSQPLPGVESTLRHGLAGGVDLPEGLSVRDIWVRVTASAERLASGTDALLAHLFAEPTEADADVEVTETWRRDYELARAAREAVSAGEQTPDEERELLMADALERFAELTKRLGEMLPTKHTGQP